MQFGSGAAAGEAGTSSGGEGGTSGAGASGGEGGSNSGGEGGTSSGGSGGSGGDAGPDADPIVNGSFVGAAVTGSISNRRLRGQIVWHGKIEGSGNGYRLEGFIR